ncbi:MAG: hypothetical protein ACJAVV_000615 [Alphaproteobacteria bacterium]|jgi:hypothetical protein
MTFRFLKLMLCIAITITSVCINESNASKAISDTPMTIYYEHVPFIDAYESQGPKNAASASNLLLVNALSTQVNVKYLPTARLIAKLNENTDIATCALFKLKNTQRAAQYLYSLPISFLQTHRLYLREGMAALDSALLNDQGEVKQISNLFDTYSDAKLLIWEKLVKVI